ncbi:hypothetical protein Raf01_94460 [Rugosimonospora africana]|uniref:Transposase n=1 Tax=Rugosimonospora africana TaxID=556532 RepID=A0A8J3R1E0_9ACTN|nr:hypothetical protein Raf01_94460 [Rugosimonospora africana]
MPAPTMYPDELRERVTRLAVEARRDPASAAGAIQRIADQLGTHPEALRTWVKRAETDAIASGRRGLFVLDQVDALSSRPSTQRFAGYELVDLERRVLPGPAARCGRGATAGRARSVGTGRPPRR